MIISEEILLNLERCVAVSSPFLAKRFCTVNSARYSVYILSAVSFIIFSAAFPIMYDTDSIRKKCIIRSYAELFHRVYQPIVLYGIPDVLLLSNIFTIYTLFRRKKQQHQQNTENIEMRVSDVNSSRKQRQLTIMLVTVNLAFYLFTTPAMIMYIAELDPPEPNTKLPILKRRWLFSQLSVLLLQLHNAVSHIY